MYVSILAGFKYTGNFQAAETIFSQLQRRIKALNSPQQLKLTIAHFNALLTVYASAKARRGTHPSDLAFYATQKDRILKEVARQQLTWDSYTFTALILGASTTEVYRSFAKTLNTFVIVCLL